MSSPPRNQMGNLKAMSDAHKVTNKLNASVHTNAWRNTCRALTKSLAPIKWATCTEKPNETAEQRPPKSHVADSTKPMDADCGSTQLAHHRRIDVKHQHVGYLSQYRGDAKSHD